MLGVPWGVWGTYDQYTLFTNITFTKNKTLSVLRSDRTTGKGKKEKRETYFNKGA